MIWLMFAVLALAMYVWFHRNKLLLLFGGYFALYAVSVISNGERLLLQLLPGMPFELAYKIKFMSVYAAPALFFYISRKLIEKSYTRSIMLILTCVLSLYMSVVVFLPFRIYSIAQDFIYAGNTLTYVVLISFLIRAYVKQRFGQLTKRQFQLFFAAVWATIMLSVNVILSNETWTSMFLINAVGSLFLICVVAFFIHQYVHAYVEMDNLTKRLQMADRMKDEFLLITSHELNTPLNGIMNVSRALLEESSVKRSERENEQLLMIRNTAYRMSSMVNDIIDASHIRGGTLALYFTAVDLTGCVSVVMEVSGFLARGKNIRLVPLMDTDARDVWADEGRLMQVLYNLLHYNLTRMQGGNIRIVTTSRNGRVLICVETGEEKPVQGGEPHRSGINNGFAAGLSVAEELIELMGGVLTHSPSGMCIDLPGVEMTASPLETAASVEDILVSEVMPAEDQDRFREGRPRILIASADPVDVEHLFGMLTTEGYDTYCIGSGKEAYEDISRMNRPDLVLVDVKLPEENGFELCRQIRRHFTQVEMPVLLISSRSTSADIEAGISAGASDFITRPLDPGEIRIRINTLLTMKRLVREAAANEMAFLRSQIKPHFLYNAFGTIMSLCYTDGARAGQLLGTFSRYLRIIFHLDNTEETVELSKEIELIQAYVDIEKARFGERVQVEFDIDQDLSGCSVMPLTIEPLVENAIRHGISQKLSGGTVKLSIRKDGSFVRVVVEDDGVGMTPEQIRGILDTGQQEQGVGFRNITRRVAHMTGRKPLVESQLGLGTKVTIWLPLSFS
jgi:signal transduction histidine kinase